MRRAAPLSLLLAAAFPAARVAHAQRDYTAPRDATVDARGARALEVDARAGLLRITGVAGLTQVRVRGTARASDRALLDDIRVGALDLRDGSGGIDVEDVRGTFVVERDGSGSVSAHHVGGDFVVEQGRASRIDYTDVRGRVEIPQDRRARRRYD